MSRPVATDDVKSSRTSWLRGQNFVLVLILEDLSLASALAVSICLQMSLNFSFGPCEIVCNAVVELRKKQWGG